MRLVLCLCLPFAAGCASLVDLPDLPEEHPAHGHAAPSPAVEPSGLLRAHHDVPGQHPAQSEMQHDHMQQEGHEQMRERDTMIQPMQQHPTDHQHPRERQDTSSMPMEEGPSMAEMADTAAPPHIYLCPYHPTPIAITPGQCTHCGRSLVHYVPEAKHAAQTYTCTMHPEVQATAPGLCPKCGMTLIPAKKDGM